MKVCSIGDCGKRATSRGWCQMHYLRWYKHGDPLVTKAAANGATLAFVLAHVDDPHDVDDPCVPWPFPLGASGGGQVSGEHSNISYRELLIRRDGPPPPGKPYAIHGPCHNRACIVHVRWGTAVENQADRKRDGTAGGRGPDRKPRSRGRWPQEQ